MYKPFNKIINEKQTVLMAKFHAETAFLRNCDCDCETQIAANVAIKSHSFSFLLFIKKSGGNQTGKDNVRLKTSLFRQLSLAPPPPPPHRLFPSQSQGFVRSTPSNRVPHPIAFQRLYVPEGGDEWSCVWIFLPFPLSPRSRSPVVFSLPFFHVPNPFIP